MLPLGSSSALLIALVVIQCLETNQLKLDQQSLGRMKIGKCAVEGKVSAK